jgi:hypothetical protein
MKGSRLLRFVSQASSPLLRFIHCFCNPSIFHAYSNYHAMAPVLSTPFLLYVLLAGTSVDASAIVRPRKAANEIPAEDYNVHDGYHWTGAPGPYGTGAPVPTTTTQAAGGRQYGPGGSSRLGTSCTPSTQTVTLSSSVAVPPVITGAYPVASTNIGMSVKTCHVYLLLSVIRISPSTFIKHIEQYYSGRLRVSPFQPRTIRLRCTCWANTHFVPG